MDREIRDRKYRQLFPREERGWKPCQQCGKLFDQRAPKPSHHVRWLFCSAECWRTWEAINAKVIVPCQACKRPLTKMQRYKGRQHCSAECQRVTVRRRVQARWMQKLSVEARRIARAKWAPELAAYFEAHRPPTYGNIYAKIEPRVWQKMPAEFRKVKRTKVRAISK